MTPLQRRTLTQQLHQPPRPWRSPEFRLGRIIGDDMAQTIASNGVLYFHAVGDTGRGIHTDQDDVGQAMALDCQDEPAIGPAFFLHLGDVIYGANKEIQGYRTEFFEPYAHYPRHIIAIAGNHDGETFPGTDPEPLAAFLTYFCDRHPHVPNLGNGILRSTLNLPGVYWRMRCPFVDIVGLYSNRLESVGQIQGGRRAQGKPVGRAQKNFLIATLGTIAAERAAGNRRALVIATHHPPFSAGGKIGSQDMLDDVDDACNQAGIMPDAFFSGHAHNYQRFTRRITFRNAEWRIPFIVAGGGGHGLARMDKPVGTVSGDHRLEQSDVGFGYTMVAARDESLVIDYIGVSGGGKTPLDSVTVNLLSHTII
jgi:hypothetical protein